MQPLPTDDKALREELAELRATAEKAVRARDQFVSNMNHEFRTALASILGYTEMMYDARQSVTERLQCLGRIRQNAKSLTELVDDLLDFSRLEEGSLEVHREDVVFDEALDELLALVQSQVWKKRISLDYSFEGAPITKIHTDPRRLRQLLLCLVGNAVKFTERGNVHLTARLVGSPAKLEIDVRDTGIGIAPAVRDHLFEPFRPGESAMTRQFGGTGLGLALARQLARALGGDLVLKSTSSAHGTLFTLSIDPGPMEGPAIASAAPPEERPGTLSAPRLATATRALEGMKILLVEDSRDIQTLVSHFLRRSGAGVDIAENGYEGVKKARNGRFDLILMDLQMPVMNGIEATQHLRQEGCGTPVVALTAHATQTIKDRCMDAGCADYLTKPLYASTLLQLAMKYRKTVEASS